MKVGHYVPQLWVAPDRGRNVSGHIQVALTAAYSVVDEGHEVELITHEPHDGHELPPFVRPDIEILTVPDAHDRGRDVGVAADRDTRLSASGAVRQLHALRSLVRRRSYDVVHVHGRLGTLRMGGLLRDLRPGCPILATAIDAPPSRLGLVDRHLLANLSAVTTSCPSMVPLWHRVGVDAQLVRHGLVRDLADELPAARGVHPDRTRVLFWREANVQNGGDVCIAAFDAIAPRHPDISFELAIRPYWDEVGGLDELVDRHPNVGLHRFPYPDGISIASLVASALVVVLPFRSLTMNPQMAVLESAAMGAAVITTDVASNRDVVRDTVDGRLIPPGDVDALVAALDELLDDRVATRAMGHASAARVRAEWIWDDHGPSLERLYHAAIQGRRP